MTAAIGCAIEYREHGSEGKRSQLAGLISSSIARQLGWKPADCDGMRIATTLVGIGRLAIPEGLMLRRSTLTLRELSGMRDQFSRGALWLIKSAGSDPAPVLKQAIAAISDYHEQWDGNGFPNGKYGEAIAIEARIILLASTITDWIAEDRRGIEASLDELSSIRFDPTLTAIASELLSEWRRTWSGIAAEQSTRQ
jgi:response regulator RpfG family c-di-GMP phosphodiesterase